MRLEVAPHHDVALALGYLDEVDAKLFDALDHVRATLVKNVT
jgi:hypothetical protein